MFKDGVLAMTVSGIPDLIELQKEYDCNVAWLRDCTMKGDVDGETKAEIKLMELDINLAIEFGES